MGDETHFELRILGTVYDDLVAIARRMNKSPGELASEVLSDYIDKTITTEDRTR